MIMIFNVAGIATDSVVCSMIDLNRAFSFSFFLYHAISAILNLECKIVQNIQIVQLSKMRKGKVAASTHQ